jgi:hypothetical protein
MAKDPAARFQTAEEFRQRLEPSPNSPEPAGSIVTQFGGAPPISIPPAWPKPPQTWNSRSLLLAGCVTFLVVVLTFAVIERL